MEKAIVAIARIVVIPLNHLQRHSTPQIYALGTPAQPQVCVLGIAVAVLVILIGVWVTNNRQQQLTSQLQAAQEQKAEILEAAALDQIDAGHQEVAIKMLTEAINMAPQRSETYHNRAIAYVNTGEFEAAIADFDVAVNANPHWALPLAGRASATVGRFSDMCSQLMKSNITALPSAGTRQ